MSSKGVDAWLENTTAFDRVQSVTLSLAEPQKASYIADEAHVAENTARSHLSRLVDLDIVLTVEGRATEFFPDPLFSHMRELRTLFNEHSHDDLIALRSEVQDVQAEFEEVYDAASPADLRAKAAEIEDASETRSIIKAASDWELTSYRLFLIEDAIRAYDTFADPLDAVSSGDAT